MKARRVFLILTLAVAAPLAAAIDHVPTPISAAHVRQSVALPPSPCKPGEAACARAPSLAPKADEAPCAQHADGYWCASGKLVMCSGQKVKATQVCFDGCNASAHPPACTMSQTNGGGIH